MPRNTNNEHTTVDQESTTFFCITENMFEKLTKQIASSLLDQSMKKGLDEKVIIANKISAKERIGVQRNWKLSIAAIYIWSERK